MKNFKQRMATEIKFFSILILKLCYLPLAIFFFTLNLPFLQYLLLIFALTQPGYVIYGFIHNSKLNPWPIVLAFRIAYSILFLYIIGLINTVASNYFPMSEPLGTRPALFSFIIAYSLILFISYLLKRHDFTLKMPKMPTINDWHYVVHSVLLFLAYSGATIQNNGGSSTITYGLYFSIFLLFIFYLIGSKRYSDNYIGSYFLSASASLMLSYSLRSSHISGYDISQEFKYFIETKNSLAWMPEKIVDAYQACLSITILPTLISQLSTVQNEFIFKFLFVLLISPIPVIAYYIFRRYFAKDVAIIGVFFLLSQTWYYTQLPTILRQGIAYIFYSLIFYSLFAEDNSKIRKNVALIILGLGLVLSHYTTTYLTVSLLILIKLILIFLRLTKFSTIYTKIVQFTKIPANKYVNLHSNISTVSIIFLLAFTTVWYINITKTFPDFNSKAGFKSNMIEEIRNSNYIGKIAGIFNYRFQNQNNSAVLKNYVENYTNNLHKTRPYLWDKKDEKGIGTSVVLPKIISVREQTLKPYIPLWFSQILLTSFTITRTLLNNILLPLSILIIFFFKRYKQIQTEYIVLQVILMTSIIGISILPQGLKSYNIERLYTQLLITSSAFIPWILFRIFKFIKLSRLSYVAAISVVSLYFFFYSGIVQYLIGGSQPLTITNTGSSYYKNFAHTTEVASSSWLGPYLKNSFVFADSAGRNRLIAYGAVDQNKIITPFFASTLNNSSYVYLAFHNSVKNVVLITDLGVNTFVETPKGFLDANKNKIYSNKSTAIYK